MPPLRILCLLSVFLTTTAQAETLEIIELPAENFQPATQLSLNWDCDVLLLTTSQRYRPGSCLQDNDDQTVINELQVEKPSLESADDAQPRRKLRY